MANGDPVDEAELMLRRFDPVNDRHCWVDQADGGTKRIAGGALNYGSDGYSFFQDSVLERNDLGRPIILEVPSWAIAGANAGEITNLERGEPPQKLLSVVEDAYPEGQEGAARRDVAHALVKLPEEMATKSMTDKWASLIARHLRPISHDR